MDWSILTVMARQARKAVEADIAAGIMSADEIIRDRAVLRAWRPGSYAVGDVRVHKGAPWRCCQAHDSTADPSWEPGAVAALWAPYHATEARNALPYVAPTGAHDAYRKGEVMVWKGEVYRSQMDALVYDPEAYPAGWERTE